MSQTSKSDEKKKLFMSKQINMQFLLYTQHQAIRAGAESYVDFYKFALLRSAYGCIRREGAFHFFTPNYKSRIDATLRNQSPLQNVEGISV